MKQIMTKAIAFILLGGVLPIYVQGMDHKNADAEIDAIPIASLNFSIQDIIDESGKENVLSPQKSPVNTNSNKTKTGQKHQDSSLGWDVESVFTFSTSTTSPTSTSSTALTSIPTATSTRISTNSSILNPVTLPQSLVSPKAISISFEYLLYQFEDPKAYELLITETESKKAELLKSAPTEVHIKDAEIASIKRTQAESQANLDYFYKCQKAGTFRSISLQPEILKNELRKEDEDWQRRRDDEFVQYEKAWTELETTKVDYQKAQTMPNLIKHKRAQRTFDAIHTKYMKKHGPKDVQLGKREVTHDEITLIEKEILRTIEQKAKGTTPKVITSPSTTFYYPIGRPYRNDTNDPKIKGFTISTDEPPCVFESTMRFVTFYDRQNGILDEFYVSYMKAFYTDKQKWAFFTNFEEKVQAFQRATKESLENKYPLLPPPGKWLRDTTTDEGKVLAVIGKDVRGDKLSKLRTQRMVYSDLDLDKTSRFSVYYAGIDNPEVRVIPYDCSIKRTRVPQKTELVDIVRINLRNHIPDLERYNPIFLENPTDSDLDLIDFNEFAIYLRGDDYFCKIRNQSPFKVDFKREQEKLEADKKDSDSQEWEELLQFKKALIKFVAERRDPSPHEWQSFLNFMRGKNYIDCEQTFELPKGVKMVDEYVACLFVRGHKRLWDEVLAGLPRTNQERKLKAVKLQEGYIEMYSQIFEALKGAVEKNGNSVKDMSPYTTYRKIPPCWQLLFVDAPVEESVVPVPSEMVLRKKSITDEDVQKMRVVKNTEVKKGDYEYRLEHVLYCYTTIDLTGNLLRGMSNYPFSKVTTLKLGSNNICSLTFLSSLPVLRILDLSHNDLSNLAYFWELSTSSERGGMMLQEVDLSHNRIEYPSPLTVLEKLSKLNLGYNKITTLVGFHPGPVRAQVEEVEENEAQKGEEQEKKHKSLKELVENFVIYLNIEHNDLTGSLAEVFSNGLKHLITLNVNGNARLDLGSPYHPGVFFDYFPALKKLSTDLGEEDNMSQSPKIINMSQVYFDEQDLGIVNEGKILKTAPDEADLSISIEGVISKSAPKSKHDVVLSYYTDLGFSRNGLTGALITKERFSSDRIIKLDLSWNQLRNMEFVGNLRSLTNLNVCHNDLSFIPYNLACAVSLTYLDISENKISSLHPLEQFTVLKTIKAVANPLKEEEYPHILLKKGFTELITEDEVG